MKILHVICGTELYDTEHVLLQIVQASLDAGNAVYAVCVKKKYTLDPQIYQFLAHRNVPVQVFERAGLFGSKTVARIAGYARACGADCMHVHGYTHITYAYRAAKKCRLPVVVTAYGWSRDLGDLRLHNVLDQGVLKRCAHVITISRAAEYCIREYGISSEKITCISPGVNTHMFLPHASRVQGSVQVVGFVGQPREDEGYMCALDAAARLIRSRTKCVFHIVCEGALRAQVVAKAKSLGIEQQIVCINKSADMRLVYQLFDVFVSPSFKESSPVPLLEAMSMGLAVIATSVGAMPHIVGPGEGIVVKPGDAQGLIAAIRCLLENKEVRAGMGRKARQKIIGRHSLATMYAAYARVYDSVFQSTHKPRQVTRIKFLKGKICKKKLI